MANFARQALNKPDLKASVALGGAQNGECGQPPQKFRVGERFLSIPDLPDAE
jgi:hypothetical protein